jgi:hypothetical protein
LSSCNNPTGDQETSASRNLRPLLASIHDMISMPIYSQQALLTSLEIRNPDDIISEGKFEEKCD